jgi:preprotein translocase subunit YajC
MWFFMIRPQRKQQKALEKFRNELKKGDKVVTAGGIYGTVDEIKERYVLLKVDGETRLRVDKNSLVRDYSDAQQQQ